MMQRIAALVLLATLPVAAQDQPDTTNPFDVALEQWGAQPPAGFSLTLERLSGEVVNAGEFIRVRITHASPLGPRNQRPYPPYFFTFSGLLLSPATGDCGTLQRVCFDRRGGVNGDDYFLRLDTGRAAETDLNTYLPNLPPGNYRLAAVMIKQVLRSSTPDSASYSYGDPREYLVSNAIELEVRPATDDWVRQTLESARDTLEEPVSPAGENYDSKQQAARQIGAINHPEARLAAIEILGGSVDGQVNRQITRSLELDVPAEESCSLLRARVADPEQKLNLAYADFMAERCAVAVAPFPNELRDAPPSDPRLADYWQRRQASLDNSRLQVMAAAAERAPDADAGAMRPVRREVLEYGMRLLNDSRQRAARSPSQPAAPLPAFVITTVTAVLQELPQYDAQQVSQMLDQYWPLLRGDDSEPALRRIIANVSGQDFTVAPGYQPYPWTLARRAAIRRLVELDPAQGRAVLLSELVNFRPTLDESLTALLPRDAVLPMDDAILNYLARVRRGEVQNGISESLLIHHYLSSGAAERLKNLMHFDELCQPEFMAYFLRADPAYAEGILKRTPWDMQRPIDHCGRSWIDAVPRLIMSPPLEDYLIAHLQHGSPYVKWEAARSLSRYGTARARQPLERAYNYFHEYWKGRGGELANYRDSVMLESYLREAIARGQAWLTDPPALRGLAASCMTSRCREGSREDLTRWEEKPLRLEIIEGPEGQVSAMIAHYYNIHGLDAIRSKLAQFPEGTEFALQILLPPPERERVAAELQRTATEAGLILQ